MEHAHTDCPRVSVVVPAHNRAGSLREHIEAVLAQTFGDFEAVYVDDASTDETPSILAEYAAAHPDRFRAVRVECGAPGPARNAGVRAARGEWILFTDDDCFVPPDWVSGMVRRFETCGADALCGGFAPQSLDTRAERYLHYRMQLPFGARPKPVRAAPMMNFLIARSTFDAAGGFLDEPLEAAEDWEFCLRLGAQGKRIYYDPAVSVIHRYQQSDDAMRQRICATAALGVHIARRHGRNLTLYAGYSVLRFLASPLWILWRFPLDLYPTALRMETLFIRVRLKSYFESG